MSAKLAARPRRPPAAAQAVRFHGLTVRRALSPPALTGYAIIVAAYFIGRAGGRWAEVDSGLQALALRSVVQSGSLVPGSGEVYANGFGYAAVSTALLAFTGLTVPELQQIAFPLISALLVVPAWVLYRELSGSRAVASLSSLLLFLQPEFLFVSLRGSHERVLRLFLLVAIWLLVRSFRVRDQPAAFAASVGCFYLATFGLIATNALFGLSFMTAILTAVLAAAAFGRARITAGAVDPGVAGRLASVTASVLVLGFVFAFFLYPPTGRTIDALSELGQKLAALLLSADPRATYDPYRAVLSGWVSLPVYFLVSLSTYLLVLTTAPLWLWDGLRLLRGTARPPNVGIWLLWLLFGAFALQGGLSVLADRGGSLGGNLQYRAFPSFTTVACPLLGMALSRLRLPRHGRLALAGLGAILAVLALFKATNEPLLSNKWMFYTEPEVQSLRWTDEHARDSTVWVGLDERLSTAFAVASGYPVNNNRWDIYEPDQATHLFVVTDVTRRHSARLNQPLPALAGENRIYDNGSAQVYRLRPRTPYQR